MVSIMMVPRCVSTRVKREYSEENTELARLSSAWFWHSCQCLSGLLLCGIEKANGFSHNLGRDSEEYVTRSVITRA